MTPSSLQSAIAIAHRSHGNHVRLLFFLVTCLVLLEFSGCVAVPDAGVRRLQSILLKERSADQFNNDGRQHVRGIDDHKQSDNWQGRVGRGWGGTPGLIDPFPENQQSRVRAIRGQDRIGRSLSPKPCCRYKDQKGTVHIYSSDGSYNKVYFYEYGDHQLSIFYFPPFLQQVRYDESKGRFVSYTYKPYSSEDESCSVEELPSDVTYDNVVESCIPDNATYNGVVAIGEEGSSRFSLHSWQWKDRNPFVFKGVERHVERIVTADCAPVLDIWQSRDNQQMTMYFSDVSVTTGGPSHRFDHLPSSCRSTSP